MRFEPCKISRKNRTRGHQIRVAVGQNEANCRPRFQGRMSAPQKRRNQLPISSVHGAELSIQLLPSHSAMLRHAPFLMINTKLSSRN
jgi:hypothetical protein